MENVTETPPARVQPPRAIAARPSFHPRERFLRVSGFFFGVVAHFYIWDVFLARYALIRWYVRRTAMQRWVTIARRFRMMAVELGGMQIKLGQFLSSRADIVPEEIRQELAGLQDEVPPAPYDHVLALIIEEFGAPPNEVFATFDPQAIAAASLGQVHYATLPDGREVAVKVQRPHIEEIIEIDLSAVGWVARLIKNYPPIRRRADLDALLAEFGRVLRNELDYVEEARNAEVFRGNFAQTPGIYIPQPVIELTTRRVLVMERICGIKISDIAELDAMGVNRTELAHRLNHTYLKMFFQDGIFHADPHPGNLFVRLGADIPTVVPLDDDQPPMRLPGEPFSEVGTPFTLIFVDFGMIGRLPPQTMEVVRNGVVGLATNDADRIVTCLEQLNMILPGSDRRQIVQAIQLILRFSYDRTVREITNVDVEAIFEETQDIIFDLPFQIPQDLLYLGRALSMVAGLATVLDADINLFESIRPFARELIAREQREGDWFGRMQKELGELAQIFMTLPREMDGYYKAANRGELQTRIDMSRLERGMRRVERSNDRLTGGMLATGLFIGGVELRTRGYQAEANRAWWGALLAVLWAFWPRGER